MSGHHHTGVYIRRLILSLSALLALTLVVHAADVAQLRRVAILDLPGAPGFGGAVLSNGLLLVAHGGANTLDVFDQQKRRLIAQVQDLGDVQGVAADPQTGTVYVANSSGNAIEVISPKTWKVTDTVPLRTTPYALELTPDGSTLFVANWRDQSISAIDVKRGFRVKTEQVGGTPHNLAYDPVSRLVYASLDDRAEVVAVDSSLKVVRRIRIVGSQPTGLALDAQGRALYVAIRHAVVRLNADTGSETVRLAAPAGADALWLDHQTGKLFVAAADGRISLMQTSGAGFVPMGDVQTDVRGSTIAYDGSRDLIYLPGAREGQSKLLILAPVKQQVLEAAR